MKYQISIYDFEKKESDRLGTRVVGKASKLNDACAMATGLSLAHRGENKSISLSVVGKFKNSRHLGSLFCEHENGAAGFLAECQKNETKLRLDVAASKRRWKFMERYRAPMDYSAHSTSPGNVERGRIQKLFMADGDLKSAWLAEDYAQAEIILKSLGVMPVEKAVAA